MLAGCTNDDAAEAASVQSSQSAMHVDSATLVETAAAATGEFAVRGNYAGQFEADRAAAVGFEVSGRLVSVDHDIGDPVAKGDVLASVNKTRFRQKVREARAAVEMAQANLGKAKVAQTNLADELDRKRPLLDKELISRRDVDNLDAQLRQARQQVDVAKAGLDQSRARLQTAREDLRNTAVRAPFDAKVAARQVDPGSYVTPNTPVFRLVSDARPYIQVNVPEQDAGSIGPDKPVAVRVGALGGKAVDGHIGRIAPAIDPDTRTLRVDIFLDKAGADQPRVDRARFDRLRPGMYAQVEVELGSRDEAVTVAKQALLENRGGAPFVWVNADGTARKQPVTVGLRGRRRVEIVSGLDGGESVIIRGFEKISAGSKVESLRALAPATEPDKTEPDKTKTEPDKRDAASGAKR